MATGYVHSLIDGEVTTLREFALRCARGMGATIMMRDLPFDAPIPDVVEPSDYNAKRLEEAKAALAEVAALSPEESEKRAAADFAEAMDRHVEYVTKEAESRRRVEAMKGQVEAWTTDAEGIKAFMLEQLETSLRGGAYNPDPPVRKTGPTWRADAMAKASKDIAYHSVENAKEIARAADRTRWIQALKASLPSPLPGDGR